MIFFRNLIYYITGAKSPGVAQTNGVEIYYNSVDVMEIKWKIRSVRQILSVYFIILK
jgi:hypothetical protein